MQVKDAIMQIKRLFLFPLKKATFGKVYKKHSFVYWTKK